MSATLRGFQSLDDLSAGSSWLHAMDPRAKLVLVVVYAVLLMSAGPFQWQPVLLMAAARARTPKMKTTESLA